MENKNTIKMIRKAANSLALKIVKNQAIDATTHIFKCMIDIGDDSKNITDDMIHDYFRKLLNHYDFELNRKDYDIYNSNIIQVLLNVKRKIPPNIVSKLLTHNLPNIADDFRVILKLVPQNGCILVEGNIDEKFVKSYFSDSAGSGGGKIKSVRQFEVSNSNELFLVEFRDKNIAKRVIERKHEDEKLNKVCLFCDHLKNDVQEEFICLNVNDYPYSLVIKNNDYIEQFRQYLSQFNIKLLRKMEKLIIFFTDQKYSPDEMASYLKDFIERFSYKDWIIENELFILVESELLNLYSNSKTVNLVVKIFDPKSMYIRVEALNILIDREINTVNELIDGHKVTETRHVEDYQANLLIKDGFEVQTKLQNPNFSATIRNNKIWFYGIPSTIDFFMRVSEAVLKDIEERSKSFQITAIKAKFFYEFKEHIVHQMTNMGYNIDYQINLDDEAIITLFHLNGSEISDFITFFEQNYKQSQYHIETKESLEIDYYSVKETLKKYFNDKLIVFEPNEDFTIIDIFSEKTIIQDALRKIASTFSEHTILRTRLDDLKDEDLKYLNIVVNEQVKEICKKMIENERYIKLEWKFEESNLKLEIVASEPNKNYFVEEVKLLLEKKVTSDYLNIVDENIAKYFMNDKARAELRRIEEEGKCLINNMNHVVGEFTNEQIDETIEYNLEIDESGKIELFECKYKNLIIYASCNAFSQIHEDIVMILKKFKSPHAYEKKIKKLTNQTEYLKNKNIYSLTISDDNDFVLPLKDALVCLNKANYEYVAISIDADNTNSELIVKSIIRGIDLFTENILKKDKKLVIKSVRFCLNRIKDNVLDIFSKHFNEVLAKAQINNNADKISKDSVKFNIISNSVVRVDEAKLRIFDLVYQKKRINFSTSITCI